MFCKIKRNKNCYTIYICERKRVDGKVISKDIKIGSYGWHSLYEDEEDIEGLEDDIPIILSRTISRKIKQYNITLMDIVDKLIEVKKEYYHTYKESMYNVREEIEEDEKKLRDNQLKEYEQFKLKYQSLYYKEISEKYQEGYLMGQLSQIKNCSAKNNDIDGEEKKLLKEAFKLLSHKYHPDKGGCNEKMAMINNLKQRVL